MFKLVVAQLVERLLPTTEVRGSYPDFGKLYITYIVNYIEKTKIKVKEAGIVPIFLKETPGRSCCTVRRRRRRRLDRLS